MLIFQSCDDTKDVVDEPIIDPDICQFESIQSAFVPCLDELSENSLDIVTWNLEQFPSHGNFTIGLLENIISNMNADIIAIQEVNDVSDFNLLVDNLDGWEGEVVDISGSLDFGYLYKTCEIEILETPSIALLGVLEPRPAGKIKIKHENNNIEVTLLTIHLKCCGETGSDEANRRAAASEALQKYINTDLKDENVIVLGDWNDDVYDGPFDNFLNDDGFAFTDAAIATGPTSDWSYPKWPSHLDHILMSNRLFDTFIEAKTIKMEECVNDFENSVSDHRPVMARFE